MVLTGSINGINRKRSLAGRIFLNRENQKDYLHPQEIVFPNTLEQGTNRPRHLLNLFGVSSDEGLGGPDNFRSVPLATQ
jgi:hypothetical protein